MPISCLYEKKIKYARLLFTTGVKNKSPGPAKGLNQVLLSGMKFPMQLQ